MRDALDYMLAQQEPFPAVAVDRHWNLLKANAGAVRLVEFLVGPLAPDARINLADAKVAPDVLRPYLMNWPDVVRHFIRSLEADVAADGTGETSELLERLLNYKGVRPALKPDAVQATNGPVLPMHYRKGDVTLKLFTTIATLGTPQDIALQELCVEELLSDGSRNGRDSARPGVVDRSGAVVRKPTRSAARSSVTRGVTP